ncbi:hypothetical protein KR018_001691 [Drosophila ironensis]|nr:hypothetical protein KR018_001691 [Drosophila ironensis]
MIYNVNAAVVEEADYEEIITVETLSTFDETELQLQAMYGGAPFGFMDEPPHLIPLMAHPPPPPPVKYMGVRTYKVYSADYTEEEEREHYVFRVRLDTTMSSLMYGYSVFANEPIEQVNFYVNGVLVHPDDTIGSLGIPHKGVIHTSPQVDNDNEYFELIL